MFSIYIYIYIYMKKMQKTKTGRCARKQGGVYESKQICTVCDGFSPFEHGWIPVGIPSSASRTIDSPLKPIQIPSNILPYSRITRK